MNSHENKCFHGARHKKVSESFDVQFVWVDLKMWP